MSGKVRAGAPQAFELHAEGAGEKQNSLSVAITEVQNSLVVWQVKVEALLFERAATRELGRLDTIPPNTTGVPSRVVGIATCPGCRGFRVTVEAVGGHQGQETCNVDLGLVPYLHAAEGLVAVEPHAILHGRRYAYLSAALGAGNTNIAIPANQRIWTVTGWAFAAGGTMNLNAGAAIPIPANSAVQLAPRGTVRGAVVVGFAAIPAAGGGYIIELST